MIKKKCNLGVKCYFLMYIYNKLLIYIRDREKNHFINW